MRAQFPLLVAAAILINLSAIAQVPLTPTQPPTLTAPSPQREQPHDGGRQPLTPTIGKVPQTQPQVIAPTGVLMGYVYWDPSSIPYNASSPCPFQMRVNEGTPPAGDRMGFEQFTPVGSYKGNFSSVGSVGNYVVCQYAADHLPEGKDLQVQIGPLKGAFQVAVAFTIPPTANEPNAPIRINGGKCNQLPPASPSLSTLGSAWWSCGDHAYNVNYLMEQPRAIPGLTQNPTTITPVQSVPLLPTSGAPNGMANPGPQQQTLLPSAGTGAVNPGPIQKPNL